MDTTLDLASAIYHGADMSDAEKATKLYELLQRRETNHARSMDLARAHIRHHVDADERVKDYEAAVAAVHRALDEARIAPADCDDSQCVGSVVKRVRALVADDARLRDRVGGLLNEVEKAENRAQDAELELMKFQNKTRRELEAAQALAAFIYHSADCPTSALNTELVQLMQQYGAARAEREAKQ